MTRIQLAFHVWREGSEAVVATTDIAEARAGEMRRGRCAVQLRAGVRMHRYEKILKGREPCFCHYAISFFEGDQRRRQIETESCGNTKSWQDDAKSKMFHRDSRELKKPLLIRMNC